MRNLPLPNRQHKKKWATTTKEWAEVSKNLADISRNLDGMSKYLVRTVMRFVGLISIFVLARGLASGYLPVIDVDTASIVQAAWNEPPANSDGMTPPRPAGR